MGEEEELGIWGGVERSGLFGTGEKFFALFSTLAQMFKRKRENLILLASISKFETIAVIQKKTCAGSPFIF